MGLLTDRPLIHWHPAPTALKEAARRCAELCNRRGHALSDIAIWFSCQPREIATTLVGMNTAADVARNIAALNRPPAGDLLAEIESILAPVKNLEWPSGRAENQ
jgi:aryl-alcohol dehydrogenase-like predicted oxidoreductase